MLYDFQKEDLAKMLTVFGQQKAVFNGNIPGAGKTCETFLWLQHGMTLKERRNAVIICPASAIGVWQSETDKWCKHDATLVTIKNGKGAIVVNRAPNFHDDLCELHFILCSFDLCWRSKVLSYLTMEMRKGGHYLIIDEAHNLGSSISKRSRAVLGNLYPLAKRAMFLSGSISRNKPDQLYPVFHTIAPDLFPSHRKFLNDYCFTKDNGYGPVVVGAKSKEAMQQLGRLAKQRFLIRQPASVIESQLPDIIERKVYLDCPGLDALRHEQAAKDFAMEIDQTDGEVASAELNAARQEVAAYKMASAIQWIEQLRKESDDCPLVIFAHYQQSVLQLYEHFKDIDGCLWPPASLYYGPSTSQERQKAISNFQNGEASIFIGSYAAAEAITLHRASICIIFEMSYSRTLNEQAPKRLHRIGQKNKVAVYYLLAKNTIDEVVYNSYRRKVSEHKHLTEGA